MAQMCNWTTLASPELGMVTGFLVDRLARKSTRLESLGVSIDTEKRTVTRPEYNLTVPKVPIPNDIEFAQKSVIGTYFSSAKVTNIKSLTVLRDGSRCIGLCMTRLDQTNDILGQWDPVKAQFSAHQIYHVDEDGPLEGLSFYLSEPDDRPYVTDICAYHAGTADSGRCFLKEELSEVWNTSSFFAPPTPLSRPLLEEVLTAIYPCV